MTKSNLEDIKYLQDSLRESDLVDTIYLADKVDKLVLEAQSNDVSCSFDPKPKLASMSTVPDLSKWINTSSSLSVFYFVRPESDEKLSIMQNAFACCKLKVHEAVWIDEADVYGLPKMEFRLSFVLSTFESSIFKFIRSNPFWKIYSPEFLIRLIVEPIPQRSYPLIDPCMKNCYVTTSGLENSQEKLNLENKIQSMAGLYSDSLKIGMTHIISNTWDSPKCLFSRKCGYPLVMKPEWVEYCWNKCKTEFIYANDPVLDMFKLPPLFGFEICVSQFPHEIRPMIESMVTKHGGKFVRDLNLRTTTHLVLLKAEGEKYNKAVKSKHVKIIRYEWIENSVHVGYPLLEDDFILEASRCEKI